MLRILSIAILLLLLHATATAGAAPADRATPATAADIPSGAGPQPNDPHHPRAVELSQRGLDAIIAFEVSSESYYQKHLHRPTIPGAGSGITIGIGYDLAYKTRDEVRRDWSPYLSTSAVEALAGVTGRTTSRARSALARVRHVSIPFAAAVAVFYECTLPRTVSLTRTVFPGMEYLPPDAQAALVSLVLNRGDSLAGPRRFEMRNIAVILDSGADLQCMLEAITAEITTMKRCWKSKAFAALRERRDQEAALVSMAQWNRPSPDEEDAQTPASSPEPIRTARNDTRETARDSRIAATPSPPAEDDPSAL